MLQLPDIDWLIDLELECQENEAKGLEDLLPQHEAFLHKHFY